MTSAPSEDRVLDRIRLLCSLRRFDEAADLARHAVATSPTDAQAWCLLAQALLGRDDDAEALDAATRGAGLSPTDEWPHRLRSIALGSLGRDHDALTAAIEAVRCAPFGWHAHCQVAQCSAVVGLRDQAEGAAMKAISLAPDESHAWYVAGVVAARAKDTALATSRFQRALALDPQNANAHAGLARLRVGRGRFVDPAHLAAATSGFATATRTDPRAQGHRDSIEAVLRVFLARAAYVIFLVCYVTVRTALHSNGAPARVLPVIFLAAPGVFVVRFIGKLEPAVQKLLFRTCRRGLVGVAVGAEALSVTALVAAAFIPSTDRAPALWAAILGALCARLVLMVERRRKLPHLAPKRSRTLGIVVAAAFAVAGAVLINSGLTTPQGGAAAWAGVTSALIGVGLGWHFIRRRGARARR